MFVMYDYQIFLAQEFGGVSRYYVKLAEDISKRKDVEVVFPFRYSANYYLDESFHINKCTYTKIRGLRFLQRKFRSIVDKRMCIRCCENPSVDIVHTTWNNPYLNNHSNGKLVVTVHDMIHELLWGDRPETAREIANKKRAIYDSDAVIAISENTKNDILKIYPDVPSDKITVVYHGTNHLPEARKPYNLCVPEKYILFVGRREDYKNGMLLVEATSELMKNERELNLIYVGGGSFTRDEREILKAAQVSDRVIQLNVDDSELAYLYNNAICTVYPSSYEGFGFPILEAFDNECPIICSDTSCLPEIGGDAALYFKDKSADDLSEKIRMFLYDDQIRSDYIKRGKERVKLFTWSKCAEETLKIYEKVAVKL